MLFWPLLGASLLTFWYTCGYLLYEVPKHEAMFKSLNAKLPGITIMALEASRFLQGWWYIALPLGTAAILAGCLIVRGVSQAAGVVAAAVALVLLALAAWGCHEAIALPIRELQRVLS